MWKRRIRTLDAIQNGNFYYVLLTQFENQSIDYYANYPPMSSWISRPWQSVSQNSHAYSIRSFGNISIVQLSTVTHIRRIRLPGRDWPVDQNIGTLCATCRHRWTRFSLIRWTCRVINIPNILHQHLDWPPMTLGRTSIFVDYSHSFVCNCYVM